MKRIFQNTVFVMLQKFWEYTVGMIKEKGTTLI